MDSSIFDLLHTGIDLGIPLSFHRDIFFRLVVLSERKVPSKLLKQLSCLVWREPVDFIFDVFYDGRHGWIL